MNLYIKGYAAIFEIADEQNDILSKNAKIFLPRQELKILWQHNLEQPIGKITKLYKDNFGLMIEGNIYPLTLQSREACLLIENEIINSLSIGFKVKDCLYKGNNRVITNFDLYEISVVTFPANKHAKIKIFKQ